MARTTLNLTNEQVASLTLDNFKTVTGHRFRMTRDQVVRQLSREQAFSEFVAGLQPATAGTTTPSTQG